MINFNKHKLKQGDNNYSLEICSFIHFIFNEKDEVMNNERRKPLVIILLFIGGVWKVCLCCSIARYKSYHHIGRVFHPTRYHTIISRYFKTKLLAPLAVSASHIGEERRPQ